MNSNPLVSIYIPCLNGGETIRRCLKSVLEQDYPNFEVIVVDNGSTDNSVEIIGEFMETSDRIEFFRCPEKGLSAVRNLALKECEGEWVATVDCDDELLPQYVSTMMKEALSGQADMVVSGYFLCKSGKRKIHSYEKSVFNNKEAMHRFFLTQALNNNHCWGKLVRKSLFDGLEYRTGCLYEDLELLPKLLEKVNCMVVVPDCNYKYYVSDASISRQPLSMAQIDGLRFRKENALFYESNYPKLKGCAYDAVISFGFFLLGKYEKKGNEEAMKALGKVRGYIDEAGSKGDRKGILLKGGYMLYKISYKMSGKFFALYSDVHK